MLIESTKPKRYLNLLFTNKTIPSKILLISEFGVATLFYIDVDDSYVDMTSVRNNRWFVSSSHIISSKPEALQILNLIEGNASKNVDSIDGKIVFLKLC